MIPRFDGLNAPYSTLVVDPPWHYVRGGPYTGSFRGGEFAPPPYSMMTADEIAALDVQDAP